MRVWALGLLLLALPLAGAEPGIWNPTDSTPVTLWMHCDGMRDCAVNTQTPEDTYQARNLPLFMHSQGCVEAPAAALASTTHHTTYGYSSPDYVYYDINEGGSPRYWASNGLYGDVQLDQAVTPMFHWYVATSAANGLEAVPIVVPQVQVTTTIRAGDDVSIGYEALNAGAIISQGASAAVDLSPLVDHPQVSHHNDNGLHIYGFHFPLQLAATTIASDGAFNIRVDVSMANPVCNDAAAGEYLMPNLVARYGGGDLWPHLDWNLFNPLTIIYLQPQFVGEDVVIHARAASPWGPYDIAGDGLDSINWNFTIDGPSEAKNVVQVAYNSGTNVHHAEVQAADATWLWPYVDDDARPGLYQAHLRVTNDQGTATAWANATFEIGTGAVHGCSLQAGTPVCTMVEGTPQQTTPFLPATLLMLGLLGLVRANKP